MGLLPAPPDYKLHFRMTVIEQWCKECKHKHHVLMAYWKCMCGAAGTQKSAEESQAELDKHLRVCEHPFSPEYLTLLYRKAEIEYYKRGIGYAIDS